MKRNRMKSKKEWEIIIERWRESGLSQTDFCRMEGLTIQTFGKWKSYHEKSKSKISPQSFLPVQIKNKECVSNDQSSGIEIQCRDLQIYLQKDFCSESLKRLISVLG